MAFREWLVTDRHGGFAMGTPSGARERKYHGFYSSIPGRGEASWVTDFDMRVDDQPLWPHLYAAKSGDSPVLHPDPEATSQGKPPRYTEFPAPEWKWKLDAGTLSFSIRAKDERGGVRLCWSWKPSSKKGKRKRGGVLRLRPLWAMRSLHGTGGQKWTLECEKHGVWVARGSLVPPLYVRPSKGLSWKPDEDWYYSFHYPEEKRRGYLSEEDLYSAGEFVASLPEEAQSWTLDFADRLDAVLDEAVGRARSVSHRVLDFVLMEPAGIVAGFPWFGEWGRDTFISLPGVAAAWIRSGEKERIVNEWVEEVLTRWGEWIRRSGMLPNIIESGGAHQWQSSDATLWWCHSLAALWCFGQAEEMSCFDDLDRRFGPLLGEALSAIESGRHLFLHPLRDGMLEVTEPHSTWMDAQIDDVPVTPRKGRLPEIDALWFQAHCLHALWLERSNGLGEEHVEKVVSIGLSALERSESGEERHRPNRIFLHSLPLAPSFVLGIQECLRADLERMTEELWTPVGLRTLRPGAKGFHGQCVGSQAERDQAYHQGAAWGWLGGHYEMARARLGNKDKGRGSMFGAKVRRRFPIEGHIPEIFDAEEPFEPRGAPAQAWSLACLEEAETRRSLKIDQKISKVLARRWMGRAGRAEAKLKKAI